MQHFRSVWLVIALIFAYTTLLSAQNEFKYSYMPKKVYENQLFPVTVIAPGEKTESKRQFTFDSSSKIQPLFKEPLTIHNGPDSFYTFYFKASNVDIRIPRLFISSESGEHSLGPNTVFIESLEPHEEFCHVLAADMKIKNSQVSNYDEKRHIVTLSVEAFEANLEDMKLDKVEESGVENIKRDFAKVEGEFYVVLPVEDKLLKFAYFNTIKKQYEFLEVPVEVVDASVTTQSDLNPKEDSFEKLKKYTFMSLVGFFFIMFLFKRDFFYLVFGVVSFITLLTFYIPHKKICVKQGAPLYILPTHTSTVSTKIDQKLDTMLLSERDGFKKVEYKEGVIGWIKNEDLCDH
ncbi:hypothetical protein MN086_05780 [Sulfurovum sp. XGS-02]|uniref:hypothetical protein n=1 Tax=Sulfurovum sp. XGS-02 TaxID=2925411 RepID=UPI00204B761E|nr:hypothetical protein [Sulfurovum sp. XGS-02]UPT76562.1 hypothetical protein MN086_05780 [Sulfurovum sp. XGS-02]